MEKMDVSGLRKLYKGTQEGMGYSDQELDEHIRNDLQEASHDCIEHSTPEGCCQKCGKVLYGSELDRQVHGGD